MRRFAKFVLPLAAAITIGAAPAMAADYIPGARVMPAPMAQEYGPFTLQQALAVAQDIGVVTVQNTHFDGDQWEIEGRDGNGKWIEVDVDARTGEVRNVDRSIL